MRSASRSIDRLIDLASGCLEECNEYQHCFHLPNLIGHRLMRNARLCPRRSRPVPRSISLTTRPRMMSLSDRDWAERAISGSASLRVVSSVTLCAGQWGREIFPSLTMQTNLAVHLLALTCKIHNPKTLATKLLHPDAALR